MLNWPFAIVICIGFFVFAALFFFCYVYSKEISREKEIRKEQAKMREDQMKLLSSLEASGMTLIPLTDIPIPKAKKSTESLINNVNTKNKKIIN